MFFDLAAEDAAGRVDLLDGDFTPLSKLVPTVAPVPESSMIFGILSVSCALVGDAAVMPAAASMAIAWMVLTEFLP